MFKNKKWEGGGTRSPLDLTLNPSRIKSLNSTLVLGIFQVIITDYAGSVS